MGKTLPFFYKQSSIRMQQALLVKKLLVKKRYSFLFKLRDKIKEIIHIDFFLIVFKTMCIGRLVS